MSCPTCAAQAPPGAVFCPGCGSRVGVVDPPSMFARTQPETPSPAYLGGGGAPTIGWSTPTASSPGAPTGQPVLVATPAGVPPLDRLPVYTRRSGGGRGLGLIVVVVGLLMAGGIAFAVLNVQRSVEDVFASSTERFESSGALGEELAGPTDLRATVSDWNPATALPGGQPIPGITAPRPGYRFASANALVCVGPNGFSGAGDFTVRMADGTDERAVITQRVVPGGLGTVAQGQCQRGSLVFELPEGGQPVAVVLNGRDSAGFANPLAPVRLEWTLPG